MDVTKKNASGNFTKVVEDEKENECTQSSLGEIGKVLLETNQLLRGVLKRVDNCEKQIKSFENKLGEAVGSSAPSSSGSTPSRKKAQVPEEVRVRYN